MEEKIEEQMTQSQLRNLFIEDQTNCALCGTKLVFKHTKEETKIQEEAICESCGITTKRDHFEVH